MKIRDILALRRLKHLGAKDVRLYNGGWSHWGNRLILPVVEGEEPYAGESKFYQTGKKSEALQIVSISAGTREMQVITKQHAE